MHYLSFSIRQAQHYVKEKDNNLKLRIFINAIEVLLEDICFTSIL